MAVVSVMYDEPNTDTYKGVGLSTQKGNKLFNSGNFVKDWYDMIKELITNPTGEPVAHSSSVNHFIMDGAPYDSAYLNTNEVELNYEFTTDGNIEFFVERETTPTWDELRKLCGDGG